MLMYVAAVVVQLWRVEFFTGTQGKDVTLFIYVLLVSLFNNKIFSLMPEPDDLARHDTKYLSGKPFQFCPRRFFLHQSGFLESKTKTRF